MRPIIFFLIATFSFFACSSNDEDKDMDSDTSNSVIISDAKIKSIDNRIVPGGLLYIKGQGFKSTDKIIFSTSSKNSLQSEVTFTKIDADGGWINIPTESQLGNLALTLVRNDAQQKLGNINIRISSLYGLRGENGKNILVKIDTSNMSETIICNNFKDMEYLAYIPETHEIIGWIYNDVTYDSHCEIYSFKDNSFRKLNLSDNVSGGSLTVTNGRIYGGCAEGIYSITLDGKDERCEHKWNLDPELFVYMPMQNCIIAAGESYNNQSYESKFVIYSLTDNKIKEITVDRTIWSMCPVNEQLYYVTTGSDLLNTLNVLDVNTGISSHISNNFELDANMVYLESRNELIGTPMDELTNDESMKYLFKYNIGTKKSSKIEDTKYYWELFRD